MRIEHIAIWCRNLEEMRDFYCEFFKGISNDRYINTKKGFESYFISFDRGARLELMKMTGITSGNEPGEELLGITHLAFSLDGRETVDTLTDTLRKRGYTVAGEPRTTGDGYYESIVLDPEGNRLELVG